MRFVPTEIPDVVQIIPRVHEDNRGFFMETYRRDAFAAAGIDVPFIQDNHSRSPGGILRGLHYQIRHAQGKLVRVVTGEIFDVAVDLRKRSDTFGKWVGAYLSGENKAQLWIPPGFAHGFYVVSSYADVIYKVTDRYAPRWDRTILWDDPEIGIKWPIPPGEQPMVSAKDAAGVRMHQAEAF